LWFQSIVHDITIADLTGIASQDIQILKIFKIISNDLLAQLKTEDEYNLREIGECELRGKDEKVILQTVQEL
jgi:hypothetical protein